MMKQFKLPNIIQFDQFEHFMKKFRKIRSQRALSVPKKNWIYNEVQFGFKKWASSKSDNLTSLPK